MKRELFNLNTEKLKEEDRRFLMNQNLQKRLFNEQIKMNKINM
jgi:hypothetical protein